MKVRARSWVSFAIITAMLLPWIPAETRAGAPAGGRLEGLVIGVDGRPAAGHTVYLIDEQGAARQTTTSSEGLYSFQDVAAGLYNLGVQTPAGAIAPATAPPLRLQSGRLARRDLRLLESDVATVSRAATANYGVGTWWGSLSGGAKVGVLGAVLAVGYGVYEAATDDQEPCATPPCE